MQSTFSSFEKVRFYVILHEMVLLNTSVKVKILFQKLAISIYFLSLEKLDGVIKIM